MNSEQVDARMALALYQINRQLPSYELGFLEDLVASFSDPPPRLARHLKAISPPLRLTRLTEPTPA